MKNYNFKGQWIAATNNIEDRFAPLFIKNFNITKEVKNATLYICGLGFFEAKINGNLPDDSVLNPTHSQYSSTIYYRTFDVTALLRKNENEITTPFFFYIFCYYFLLFSVICRLFAVFSFFLQVLLMWK